MKCAPQLLTWENVYLRYEVLLSDLPPTLAPPALQLTFASRGMIAYM